MKIKRYFAFLIFILSILCLDICFSSWISINSNETENSLIIDDPNNLEHSVTVHGKVESLNSETYKYYYIPKEFEVKHSITPYNKAGQLEEKVFTWKFFGTKTVKLPVFYEVINDNYRMVNQWSNGSYADAQIKSFDCNVTSWEEVSNNIYGDVWDASVKKSDGSNYRLFFQEMSGRGKDYQSNIGDIIYEDKFKEEDPYFNENGDYVSSTIYLRIIVADHYRYQNGYDILPSYSYNNYSMFQLRKETTIIKREEGTIYPTNKIIKVKDGDLLSPISLNIANYKEYGYYSDSNYSIPFDFSNPITTDCDIYIKLLDMNNNEIFSAINSGTNSVINIYNSLSGSNAINVNTDFNVVGNPAFNINDKIYYLGESTLNSSRTLSLTYGNIETYIDPCEGTINQTALHRNTSNNSVSVDYDGSTYIGLNNCSLYVSLSGNLTIKGNLIIGGEVGGTNGTYYSYIIGKYTILDLHGNDLIVDGGTVKNFGLIKDTLGTGKIIVKNGGTITSTLSVTDGRGKNPSIVGFSKRQAPFTEYHILYILVPIYFYQGTSLQFYLKLDLDDIGITNLYFYFITNEANSNNKSLFCWSDSNLDNEQYLLFKPVIENEIYKNITYYKRGYHIRNQFIFNSNVKSMKNLVASLSVTISGTTKSANVDLLRIDFPVSPFFDLIIADDYTLSLNSKFIFYPGSSLYVKKRGSIKLGYYGPITYPSESANILTYNITIPGESRYLCGGIVNFSNNLKDISKHKYSIGGLYNETSNYFKIIKPANIAFEGNLLLDTTIDNSTLYNDSHYILAGEMDIDFEVLNFLKENRNILNTYDLKGELIKGFVYGKASDGNTYADLEKQFEVASCYNIQPLVSNGKGYIFDSTHEIVGDYNKSTNLVTTSNGEKYALLTSEYMYEGGNNSANQKDRVDRTIIISKVATSFDQYNIIELDNGDLYLLFSGIYCKILDNNLSFNFVNNDILRINTSKFISNVEGPLFVNMIKILTSDNSKTTVSVNLAPLYSDATIYYSSSLKIWSYKYFTSYPTIDLGNGYRYSY